jgi:uncharacterized membrane protein
MERREKFFSITILVFFIIFLIWILLQFIAPLALPNSSVGNLSGCVYICDNEESIDSMPSPWKHVYSVGDSMCHEKAERSLFINNNQMPFCSRCTAIWLGLAIGLGVMVFYKIGLDDKFIFLIIIGLVPIGIDGLGQLAGFWESNNIIRIITGLNVGIVCGIAISIIIDLIKDIVMLKNIK